MSYDWDFDQRSRDLRIIELLSFGYSYHDIADDLDVPRTSINNWLHRLYVSTATGSRDELVDIAIKRGWINEPLAIGVSQVRPYGLDRAIIIGLARDHTNRRIAHTLSIPVRTVIAHVRRLMAEYEVASFVGLVTLAVAEGWIRLESCLDLSHVERGIEPPTEEELAVIMRIAEGSFVRKVAAELQLAPSTLDHKLSAMYRRYQLADRLGLAVLALREQWIEYVS